MFSKKLGVIAISLLIGALWITGCGILGDSEANIISAPNNIAAEAGCMTQALDDFGRFFGGDSSGPVMLGATSCLEDSVALFGKKVRGENPNYYKPREVANFIQNQFLDPGVQIPDQLLTEIMRLKQLFVGGTTDQLTREELTALKNFVHDLGPLLADMAPEMKILSGNWPAKNLAHADAISQFAASETRIAQKLQSEWPAFKAIYDLKNLQNLADGLHQAFPNNAKINSFQNAISKYLPLAIAAKNILLKDDQSILATGDWAKLLKRLPALLSRYLYYSYFLADTTSMFWGIPLADFENLVHTLLDNLQAILTDRGQGISITELNNLADGLGTSQFLTGAFSASAIKTVIPIAVHRFLTTPSDRLAGKPESTLSTTCLTNLRTELDAMFSVQETLNTYVQGNPTPSHAQLRAAFQNTTGPQQEFSRILQSPNSFASDDQGRMFIDVASEIPYTVKSLQRLNIVRTLVRFAFRSYAKDATRVSALSNVTQDEVLTDVFGELKPFLVQANLIDASNTTFAKSRFIEANLFTPTANGDKNLDFYEASGIGLMIWSGLSLNDGFEPAMNAHCSKGGTLATYDVACSMDQIRQNIPSNATSLPRLVSVFQTLPAAQINTTLTQMLKAAGWVPTGDNTAKMADLSLVPHVLQYVESIYRRWDTNKDNIIDKNEAMVAEPTFRPLLADLSGQTDPGTLRAAFAYILVYKKNPADNIWDFLVFMNDESKWTIKVARTDIADILGFIADQMRAKSWKNLELSQL